VRAGDGRGLLADRLGCFGPGHGPLPAVGADPVNTRLLMLDNFNFSAIRATLYAATPAGGGGE